MVIFHCYVSSPEGKSPQHPQLISRNRNRICSEVSEVARSLAPNPLRREFFAVVFLEGIDQSCKVVTPSTWILDIYIYTGWWYTYPSEKYEFVSWDDDIPIYDGIIKHV